MAVVPAAVLQRRRCSGRIRFGFPQNSFIVTKNRLRAMDLMVKEQQNELGETVFDCWGKPPNGEEFNGYDRFKHNQLDYPDYTKIKICDAYVKLDVEKGELQWWPHRAKTLVDYDVTVQDGKKVKVPKYVCVPVNPETLEDVAGAADVTLPAYRLRRTVWRPFTEEAPDCEVPFPEERQCKKKKVISRKSKSKRKMTRKKDPVSRKRVHEVCDDQKPVSAAAVFYNDSLNKYVNLPLTSASHLNVSVTLVREDVITINHTHIRSLYVHAGKSYHTARSNVVRENVVTLPVQMWSHCPCKCGHIAQANVVNLPVQMWSHYPCKCGHTVRANVVPLPGQMWSHCRWNCSHVHIRHYMLCADLVRGAPASRHACVHVRSWHDFKAC